MRTEQTEKTITRKTKSTERRTTKHRVGHALANCEGAPMISEPTGRMGAQRPFPCPGRAQSYWFIAVRATDLLHDSGLRPANVADGSARSGVALVRAGQYVLFLKAVAAYGGRQTVSRHKVEIQ